MEGGRIEIQHAAALQNANTVRLNAVVTLYRHCCICLTIIIAAG